MLKYPHEDMWIVKVVLFIPKPPNVWVSQGHCPNTIVDEALFMGAFLWPLLFSLCWTSRHFFSSRYYTISNCLQKKLGALLEKLNQLLQMDLSILDKYFLTKPRQITAWQESVIHLICKQLQRTDQLQISVAMLDIEAIKQSRKSKVDSPWLDSFHLPPWTLSTVNW